ncbi:MAG: hypothetical protein GF364_12690 [Candidatus Lokiarchaeota archaeon]|nr:hypothetical protein [Candidatus Lokiarchaeota archaeon]
MAEQNFILTMLFGFFYTFQMHISEGMQKHGIDVFNKKKRQQLKGKKKTIWIIGFMLMITVDIHQIVGLAFGTVSQFLALFGLGLIFLCIYSVKLTHETLEHMELIGISLIILGTLTNGVFLAFQKSIESIPANMIVFLVIFIISILIVILLSVLSIKFGASPSICFGISSAICAAVNLIFKRLGYTNNLWFLGISFVMGLFSMIFMNVGFARGADATKLIPFYNSVYIIYPTVIESIIFEDPALKIHFVQYIAIFFIVAGVILITKKIAHKP